MVVLLAPSADMDMTTEARACIDEEITKQILSLCNLRTRRNTLSLISRLPTETLATIFIHCAHDYHCEDSSHFTRTVPDWVNVSYVCRHWRNVALNCPTLWSYIFMKSQRWTEELLARSKQASLKLRVRGALYEKPLRRLHIVEQVINQAERIQELCLHLPPTDTHEVLSKLSSRAPRLQTLKILVFGDACWQSFILFDGDTPALRTLELSDCSVPLHSLNLSGLTTLSLNRIPGRFQQSMPEFLATLSCMPGLSHLYLENDVLASDAGFLSSSAFNTSQKISLPYLSRLLVGAPISTVIALLSCVNIPLKTEVRLLCVSYDPSPDDFAPLSSVLAQRFSISKGQAPTIRSLVVDFAAWGVVKLKFSGKERDCDSFGSISCLDWGCNIPLKITIDSDSDSDLDPSMMTVDGVHIIRDICCSVPLMNVESIHVTYPPFSPSFWRKMLGHLPHLRYIKLSYGNMPDLASVLAVTGLTAQESMEVQGGHAPSDPDRARISVPMLKELELYRITFSPGSDSDMPDVCITRWCLFDALSTRNAPGLLTMTRCDDDSSILSVVVRSWDELVGESDSDSLEGSVSDYDWGERIAAMYSPGMPTLLYMV